MGCGSSVATNVGETGRSRLVIQNHDCNIPALLQDCSVNLLAQFAEAAEWKKFEASSYIINGPNSKCPMFFISHGEVSVHETGRQTKNLSDGDHFAETSMLLNEEGYTIAIANTDCEILELKRDSFFTLLESWNKLASLMFSHMDDRDQKHILEQVQEKQAKVEGNGGRSSVRPNLQRKSTKLMLDEIVSKMAGAQSDRGLDRFIELVHDSMLEAEGKKDSKMLRVKVAKDNARPGLLVFLNLDAYRDTESCRFPGDDGPGILMEDHVGDSSMWRVRWIYTNTWGIYNTGFEGQYHLWVGSEKDAPPIDPDLFMQKNRMPSFFFCCPVADSSEGIKTMHNLSSPRSRLFLPALPN